MQRTVARWSTVQPIKLLFKVTRNFFISQIPLLDGN